MGMEHPRDAIHIRRVILHDSNDKQGVWGLGLHGSDVPGSIDHTAYVEKYTAIAQEMAVQRGSIVSPDLYSSHLSITTSYRQGLLHS